MLSDLARAFYSPALYYREAHRARGIGMRYVCALSFALIIGYYISIILAGLVAKVTSPEVIDRINHLPALTFKEGKIAIDAPTPYVIPIGKDKDIAYMIIDTNYHSATLDGLSDYMTKNHVLVLLTDSKMITQKSQGELDIHDLSTLHGPFTITHENWHTFTEKLPAWATIGFYVIIPLFSFLVLLAGNFILTFFNAVAVLVTTFIFRAHVDFGGCMRLAAALRWVVNIIVLLGGVILQHSSGLIGWGVWFIYLIGISWAVRPQNA